METLVQTNHRIRLRSHILGTTIQNAFDVRKIAAFFDLNQSVIRWSVDLHDWEKVLKVVATDALDKESIASYLASAGFECEELKD